MSKIKNILIFIAVGGALALVYVYFIRSPEESTGIISSTPSGEVTQLDGENPSVAGDFLRLLLSVKNIRLDDAIFSDNAFNSLRDSSIMLTPDGSEGRPNPFAAFGAGNASIPAAPTVPTTPITTPPTPTG